MHRVCNSTPVAVDVSASIVIAGLQTFYSLLQLSEGTLPCWGRVAAVSWVDGTPWVWFLVFEFPDENPDVRMTNSHFPIPSVVKACAANKSRSCRSSIFLCSIQMTEISREERNSITKLNKHVLRRRIYFRHVHADTTTARFKIAL